MQNQDALHLLRDNYQAFRDRIISLSDQDFLTFIDGWSPRDVVAHLIGWNRHMIQASSSILAGQAPAYYADAPNDYSNMNAGFVQKYSSRSKRDMLSELANSMNELAAFLLALSPGELEESHSIRHYRRQPATVAGIIASLAGDYQQHTHEINEWFRDHTISMEG